MDRLFLTVYAKLLAAIVAAALAAYVLVAPEANGRIRRNFESTATPAIALAAHMLSAEHARGGNIDETIANAAPTPGTRALLVPESELTLEPSAAARFAAGMAVHKEQLPHLVLCARIDGTGRALCVGPPDLRHPLGEGRSVKILAIVIGALVAGVYLVLRPMRIRLAALSRVALTLGKGDLTARAEIGPNDAIGHLSSALNRMADELTRQIAAQQELLHMVSHELRTPLQRMRFNAEALRSAGDEARREQVLKRVERDVEELDDLLAELLAYVRLGEHAVIAPQDADVRAVLDELCETHSDTKGGLELSLRTPSPVNAAVDVRLVRRAVSNLVVNALAYAKSRVEVSVERDDDTIRIQVDDDGSGIPEKSRERIFQPFQRLDDEQTGTRKSFGLGLAIVRRVAELHGGTVLAETSDLGGARFRLELPAAHAKAVRTERS